MGYFGVLSGEALRLGWEQLKEEQLKEVGVPKKLRTASAGSGGSSPVVKSGKRTTVPVTDATVERLERVGSSESAKIARDYVPKS